MKIGISLFSLGTPYLKGQMELEDLIRCAAEMGAEGYEIVAAQMIPSYPFVSDEFVALVERCRANYGIGPECYGASMDRGLLPGRDLTEDEMVARSITDIISAHRLGCKVLRTQIMLPPSGLARLAPYAEAYQVKVGLEIHNPESPITPAVQSYVEAIRATGSDHLGLIIDFGCFATRPNKPYWDRALAAGAPLAALEKLAQLRYDEVPQQEAAERMAEELSAYPVLHSTMSSMYGFVQFRRSCTAELAGMKALLPYCLEMHGKCHYVSEDLHEASIPYEEIVPVLVEGGYEGFVMTEFEDEGGYDAVEQTARHVAMMKKLAGNS